MAVASPATPAQSPASPKARRAWAILTAHEQRMAERRGGLREYYCGACGALIFEYVPPVGLVAIRCRDRDCRTWASFTTEQR